MSTLDGSSLVPKDNQFSNINLHYFQGSDLRVESVLHDSFFRPKIRIRRMGRERNVLRSRENLNTIVS